VPKKDKTESGRKKVVLDTKSGAPPVIQLTTESLEKLARATDIDAKWRRGSKEPEY